MTFRRTQILASFVGLETRCRCRRAIASARNRGRQGASMLGYRLIVAYLLLAAPIASAVLFWGSWGWVVAAVVVAVVEFATLQRSQRFSARVWRSLRVGRRSSRERAAESLYVITAFAGVALLAMAVLSAV
jgi:hypothetical protein